MRLLITGPPGSGKGTQGEILARTLGVPHISTGDIFRTNIRDRTPLGLEAGSYIAVGGYVRDGVTNAMIFDRLSCSDVELGFLLDGYPRTTGQVEVLDDILAQRGAGLDGVIHLDVDQETLVKRLLARAVSADRVDDSEKIIRHRQQVYRSETEPLLDIFRRRGLLVAVSGVAPVEQVQADVLAAIATLRS